MCARPMHHQLNLHPPSCSGSALGLLTSVAIMAAFFKPMGLLSLFLVSLLLAQVLVSPALARPLLSCWILLLR